MLVNVPRIITNNYRNYLYIDCTIYYVSYMQKLSKITGVKIEIPSRYEC